MLESMRSKFEGDFVKEESRKLRLEKRNVGF